jgi:valyl-tRNA synthetase
MVLFLAMALLKFLKDLSNPDNEDVKYYYPTQTLVTAPEIIFFWVARMIMSGYEYRNEKPFEQVYFTGIVRDKQGRKMSKSLGNSPDLLDLIEKYGADAVRFGILIASPAGNDLLFDEKLIEQGRNFNNKLWNVMRLIKGWEVKEGVENVNAVAWYEAKLNASLEEMERLYADFHLSAVLKELYSLIWDDFCSWYLEMVKPEFGAAIDSYTYNKTISFLEKLMQMLHPVMPFITEEIYSFIKERAENDFITVSSYPVANVIHYYAIEEGERAKSIITTIRDIRNKNQIKPKERLCLYTSVRFSNSTSEIIRKLSGLKSIESWTTEPTNAIPFLISTDKFFLESPNAIDVAGEKSRLEKDIAYQRGFLESVMKKLENERFISKASAEVISNERKKAEDAQEKIRLMEERLNAFSQ